MKPNRLVRALSLVVLASSALTAQVARKVDVPLRNWATPLYWQPSQMEKEAARTAIPQLQFSANAVSTTALTFVAITPCRLVDTRGAGAGFNGIAPFSGPSIASGGTLTFPVQSTTEATANTTPAPCGAIPNFAQGYSLNVTVVPHAPGAVDYISIWPAGGTQPFVATLDDPQGAIVSNAAIVPAGTPTGGISVYNAGPATTDVIIDMNGYYAAPTDASNNTALGSGTLGNNTTGNENTADGANALQSNTTGGGNTASGFEALQVNTTGSENTASGFKALQNNTSNGNTADGAVALLDNTSGNDNTAIGADTLVNNTTGSANTANGVFALVSNLTGSQNTASGVGALQTNRTGGNNTAIGYSALYANATGNGNIAIGYQAAYYVSEDNSNNIHIGSQGASGDGAAANSGVIRIGTINTQTSTFIAGISAATPGTPNLLVCVDANGQLGTTGCSSTPSSRRFKEQISDMGDRSSKLLQLRPVTFFYKPEYDDGSHALQYGLIAEEVAEIYPDMVGYDQDGQPASVRYQSLAPMLLNEVQKQAEQNRQQAEQIRSLQAQGATIKTQSELIRTLEDRLAALEASYPVKR